MFDCEYLLYQENYFYLFQLPHHLTSLLGVNKGYPPTGQAIIVYRNPAMTVISAKQGDNFCRKI